MEQNFWWKIVKHQNEKKTHWKFYFWKYFPPKNSQKKPPNNAEHQKLATQKISNKKYGAMRSRVKPWQHYQAASKFSTNPGDGRRLNFFFFLSQRIFLGFNATWRRCRKLYKCIEMNFSSSKVSLCASTQWKIGLDFVAIITNEETWRILWQRMENVQ